MAIHCCKGCVPQKRTPTCYFDGTCAEYPAQKQKHDEERQAQFEAMSIARNIKNQKSDSAMKALRRKGVKYGECK